MFYSIIPPEIVFDDWDGKELERYQKLTLNGHQMIVEPLEDNQVRLVQLISSDPADYLDPTYQPGNVYEFSARLINLDKG